MEIPDIPLSHSPKTPRTPAGLADITISREQTPTQPISFAECQEFARQVQSCSRSLVEGTLGDRSTVRGRRKRFIPKDFESAKEYLRASVEVLPPRRLNRSETDTPVSSRGVRTEFIMPVCHGCHGNMGGGQHQGSAPGKNICNFQHSLFCRGGIIEDVGWKACPIGYIWNQNIELASESAFADTMATADFLSMQYGGPEPNSSTPANTVPVIFTPQSAHAQLPVRLRRVENERFPRIMQGGTQPDNQGGVGGVLPFAGLPPSQVSENVQSRIDRHRAANQVDNLMTDRPHGVVNINNLRSDHSLCGEVDGAMAELNIPSLSATQQASAQPNPAPANADQRPGAYNYNANQLGRVVGDGVRVTAGAGCQQPVQHQQDQAQDSHPNQPIQPPGQPKPTDKQQPGQQQNQNISGQPTSTAQQPFVPPPHHDLPAQHVGHQHHVLGGPAPGQPQQHIQRQLQGLHQPGVGGPADVLTGQLPQQGSQQPFLPAQYAGQQNQNNRGPSNSRAQQPFVPTFQQVLPAQPVGHQYHASGQSQQQVQQHYVSGTQQFPLGQQQNRPRPGPQTQPSLSCGAQQQQQFSVAQGSPYHGVNQQSQFEGPGVQPHTAAPHYLQQGSIGLPQGLPQYCYEWQTSITGENVLVRLPGQQQYPLPSAYPQAGPTPQHSHNIGQQSSGQGTLYTQYNQHPTSPRQSSASGIYRTEFRCSPTSGRQWKIQVPADSSPVTVTPTPQFQHEWRIHPHTGASYRVQVPVGSPQVTATAPQFRDEWRINPHTGVTYQVRVSVNGNQDQGMSQSPGPVIRDVNVQHVVRASPDISQLGQQGQHSNLSGLQLSANQSLSRNDRVAGIVSLLDGEGGGVAKKQPKVLENAKKCPTKWSKYANMSNINLPLYTWGVVAEIEASLSGRAEAMQEGVMLGKIRHLKNTLEVCFLNCTATDFTAYGWTVARDYAAKVEDEVEQKLASWQEMPAGVRTSTLVSATMEHPRPVVKQFEQKKTAQPEKKDVCTTYNKCTTEGKCEYELQNPDRTCLKKHECSWCRDHKKQTWRHQAWKCKNKESGK